MILPHHGEGPIPARIMICGEAWGADEERLGAPFQGASGQELNRMLQDAGILRSEVYVTNVVNYRPAENNLRTWIAFTKKDRTAAHVEFRGFWVLPIVVQGHKDLLAEITLVRPNIIITFGNLALWALCTGQIKMGKNGPSGIHKWRGSQLAADQGIGGIPGDSADGGTSRPKVIPTYHPAAVLREWSWRRITVNDLRRAKRHAESRAYSPPAWAFQLKPSFQQVTETLSFLLSLAELNDLWLDFDIETKVNNIACLGISWTRLDGLCIPFMTTSNRAGYWSEEEESLIVWNLRTLFLHKSVHVRWQNGLYDAQHIYRSWLFVPGQQHEQCHDTMISQHSAFCALPKALAFIASMYCNWYVYWKEEGKNLDGLLTDERNWAYNLQDCVYTHESGEVLLDTLKQLGLDKVDAVQQALFWPVLRAMNRGIRVIDQQRDALAADIQTELDAREKFLYDILCHTINVSSPKQMYCLFYEDLKQKMVMKKTMADGKMVMRPSVDDESLNTIKTREPLLTPVCNAIADIRTLSKWRKDFVLMRKDSDGRMRCSFNIAGDAGGKSAPYSYRLSSSANAFGSGGNLQTIPSEKSKSAGKAAARGSMDFELPNIRSMFGPDSGYTFFDMDLDRADLHIVVWESNDTMLKAAMRLGVDVHLLNVFTLDGHEPPPLEELVEGHPKYADHRGPRKHKREFAKVFCHGSNYGGGARTMAAHTGRTINEVDRAQKIWFGAHPGIKRWHKEVEDQITKRRFVENKFGYRWYIFDRLAGLLPEAVAWIPQSSVGCTINRIWLNLYKAAPEIEVLLQVHDSLAGEFPTNRREACMQALATASKIVIPYEDPLTIPTGVKTSEKSWGDCV